jgi:hypothetical protein
MCATLCLIQQAVECPQPVAVDTGKTTPDGRPVILILRISKDGELTCDTMAINPVTSKPEPYEGECITPLPPLMNTGCQFGDNTDYCDLDVWMTNPPDGRCFAIVGKGVVEVTTVAEPVIKPKAADTVVLTRSFTCEVAAIDDLIKIDNAYVFQQLAGAQIAGCFPADDVATVTLHDFEATLTNLGDETCDNGGFVSTSCQAIAIDAETGKKKDIEPGGSIAYSNEPGYTIPAFCIELAQGSVMQLCGDVSIVVDKKTNQPVDIPVDETIKQFRTL